VGTIVVEHEKGGKKKIIAEKEEWLHQIVILGIIPWGEKKKKSVFQVPWKIQPGGKAQPKDQGVQKQSTNLTQRWGRKRSPSPKNGITKKYRLTEKTSRGDTIPNPSVGKEDVMGEPRKLEVKDRGE